MDQQDIFNAGEIKPEDRAQTLIADLVVRSRLYHTTHNYKELLDFIGRLSNIAPFNAMLLNIQKPGLRIAASEFEWINKHKRTIKEGARPLIILWPFSPVALVYDIADTEGKELPEAVENTFRVEGEICAKKLEQLISKPKNVRLSIKCIEWGDGKAGDIEVLSRSMKKKEKSLYKIRLNANHNLGVQFSTLVHELAHLQLGHLGVDVSLNIKDRAKLTLAEKEFEAESVAYLVCERHGMKINSDSYLSGYVDGQIGDKSLNIDIICKAAGHVETMVGIASKMLFR